MSEEVNVSEEVNMSETTPGYAVTEARSSGRQFDEKPHPYRGAFERDRDRIMHCSAFRRLEGKTQVFTPGVNDHYRTRLTHSIEVAQIGRTIARVLGLNEDLTEAICLAHDLGHSPFGHAGEHVLNELMAGFGGFEHNRQVVRIVDFLEHPYPDFAGLNLMYETRLGLARHHSPYDKPLADDFPEKTCSLEGQIADIADRIAYNCHDLEDGLHSRLLEEAQLHNVCLFAQAGEKINAPAMKDRVVRRTRIAKAVIDMLVSDVIETSTDVIGQAGVNSVKEVYSHGRSLVVLSEQTEQSLCRLEKFLLENMYNHPSLLEVAGKVEQWLGRLFDKICKQPAIMPGYFQQMAGARPIQRVVCDYISGMTDRYCLSILGDDDG